MSIEQISDEEGVRIEVGCQQEEYIYTYETRFIIKNIMEKAIPNPKLFIFRKLLYI